MNYLSPKIALITLVSTAICFGAAFADEKPAQPSAFEGVVTVERLEQILKAGPHALISAFLVEPTYGPKKRFIGFKLVQRAPHPVIKSPSVIQVGDIIVAANGIRLETPAQFMSAWRKLRENKVFMVDLVRNKQKLRYRWKLVK